MKRFVFPYFNMILCLPIFLGCQITSDVDDDPDNLDAPYVWRVCNESIEHQMKDVHAYGWDGKGNRDTLAIGTIPVQKCSGYFIGLHEGEQTVSWLGFSQNEKEYLIGYLESYPAVRGLVDSSIIKHTPGRYIYHTNYDVDRGLQPVWVEIEREAYH